MPPEEQSGKGLSEVLDAVIKKTTEELGHKFNKQQSIANPALGKQFLEEVDTLRIARIICRNLSQLILEFTPPSNLMSFVSGY